MEEEILSLINTTSLTDIILIYDAIEEKIHKLEKIVIDICNINQEKEIIQVNNASKNKLSELKKVIDKTTDEKIKESTIEDLIGKYKLISSLYYNN
jgi:hypothetical protein